MKYSIVSCSNKAYFQIDAKTASPLIKSPENSETLAIWKNALRALGFDPDDHGLKPDHLFVLVKTAFEKKLKIKLDVTLERNYIASFDGTAPVKHDDSSRIFAGNKIVYLDELMRAILFDYVANYYIWARYGKEVFGFCFPYALNTLNYCCRQGFLNTDRNRAELTKAIKKHCDDVAVELITDLYWSIIAFAFCHELAHISLGHVNKGKEKSFAELRQDEFSADSLGYDVFLSIIDGTIEGLESPFLACFHDYLYVAPMVLFLFYRDLYYMDYWLFGETIQYNDHPTFFERINQLLELSEDEKYKFDTEEGNEVLKNYWNISDYFCTELLYKLANGKLSHVVQKGRIPMDNTVASKEAFSFDNHMRNEIKHMAKDLGLDPNKLAGLYDIAARVELHDENSLMHFVWNKQNSAYSLKPFNVTFRMRAALIAVIDESLSFSVPENKTETIMLVLRVLLKLLVSCTVEITEDQAKVLNECHIKNAYKIPIKEEILLELTGVSRKTIDELCELKCIELIDGKVWLIEEIWL